MMAIIFISTGLHASQPVIIDENLTIKGISQHIEFVPNSDRNLQIDKITMSSIKWKQVHSNPERRQRLGFRGCDRG